VQLPLPLWQGPKQTCAVCCQQAHCVMGVAQYSSGLCRCDASFPLHEVVAVESLAALAFRCFLLPASGMHPVEFSSTGIKVCMLSVTLYNVHHKWMSGGAISLRDCKLSSMPSAIFFTSAVALQGCIAAMRSGFCHHSGTSMLQAPQPQS
jgi:hypothetical protein